ncbi:MAG TPA: septum formation initiator family protein [Vicinamibacterales bacterium]|nr:septum formation initiator family protein [Vicinamibacterales bacterium]
MSRQRVSRGKSDDQPHARPSGRRRRIVNWLLLFVTCVLVVEALVGNRGFLAMLQARHQYEALAATVASERAENARLEEEAKLLRSDPETIEDVARRDLGLMKPGEQVFIIKDIPPPAATKP